ncbi:hypothetical protein CWS01_07725 [Niallia nealsonii]|uniref:Uncharacterized protein n=1 Tax=Niallia nealsonii TaxID=115979 RepID=A0A2N0Z450_9BACI|nr:hypothetical protein CWS01_07725 [Niallia nealsonii]
MFNGIAIISNKREWMVIDISIPAITSWGKFESLCLDIYKREWNDDNAQMNGRSGQSQCGVDVFGSTNNIGVQCKKKTFLRIVDLQQVKSRKRSRKQKILNLLLKNS